MPINEPVTYSYRPAFPEGVKARMPSYESYRARGEIGGTFFRAIDPGAHGNDVSIEFLNGAESGVSSPNGPATHISLIIRGPITLKAPNYIGAGNGKMVNITVSESNPVFQTITATAVNKDTFTIQGSISGNLGEARVDRVFASNDVSFTISQGELDFTPGDKFTLNVEDPTEIYTADNNYDPNVEETTTDPETGASSSSMPDPLEPSPAYAVLRAQVNGNSKFVQMSNRGYDFVDQEGTDPMTGRSVRAAGTDPLDGPLIPDTGEVFLTQGQGFPTSPIGIFTGTERALVHINRGEKEDGQVNLINKVYEWNGSSAQSGAFTVYD